MSEENQFKIVHCFISADRRASVSELVDIGPSISELIIYESMESAFLTGELLLTDTIAIRSTFKIKGNERITLRLRATNSRFIDRNFMLTGIDNLVGVNDRTEVLKIGFIEEHAYWSNAREISKSFTGRPVDIMEKILNTELDRQVNRKLTTDNGELQRDIRYIVPGISPLSAVETIRDRACTPKSGTYFVYSTLRDPSVFISELDMLLDMTPWNIQFPYLRSTVAPHDRVGATPQEKVQAKHFHVKEFAAASHESTYGLMSGGALGSTLNVIDTASGVQQDFRHNGRETYNRFFRLDNKLEEKQHSTLDTELKLGNSSQGVEQVAEWSSRTFDIVANSFPFGSEASDPSGFLEEGRDPVKYLDVLKAQALRSILMNNMYSITVPGAPYIDISSERAAGVGTVIELLHPMITQDASNQSQKDPDRSGRYLCYRAAHRFYRGVYDVDMDIIKYTRPRQ